MKKRAASKAQPSDIRISSRATDDGVAILVQRGRFSRVHRRRVEISHHALEGFGTEMVNLKDLVRAVVADVNVALKDLQRAHRAAP